jgi:hypothetical protein
MKRLAVWALAVTLPACCVAARTSTVNPSTHLTLVEQLEAESPALVWFSDGEGHHTYDTDNVPNGYNLVPYCASVWISPDTILTAEHCVDDIGRPNEKADTSTDDNTGDDDDPTQLLLQLLDQLQALKAQTVAWTPVGQAVLYSNREDIDPKHKAYHSGRVTAVDMINDLALIKADAPGNHFVAHLRQGTIHDGEELHVVGMPAGSWWSYSHNYVSGERPEYWDGKHTRPIMQTSGPLFFGNSGGGAFDTDGNLVGIADAISRVPSTGFFIPRDVIQGFLTANGFKR